MVKTKYFLKAWAIYTVLWVFVVLSQVYEHYSPLIEPSKFIYNPMISPNSLLIENEENREGLKRSFFGGWKNIYSFGIPNTVEIEFSEQFLSNGVRNTWMPDGNSITSVSVESPSWREFKTSLINEALNLREESAQKIYRQYAIRDATFVLGAPIVFLCGFIASQVAVRFKAVNGKKRPI